MQKLILIGLLASSLANALEYGACQALTSSKRYVDGNFGQSYPKTVSFTCEYECHGENGVEKVKGLSKVRVSSVREDGVKVVCQGVEVAYTGFYYQHKATHQFYSFEAVAPEVKAWAFASVSRDNRLEEERLAELKNSLNQVGYSFFVAGANPDFSYFKRAGNTLLDLAKELPHNPNALEEALKFYVLEAPEYPRASTKGLIQSTLKSSANFRIP